jgi:hypothetical protein
MTRRSSKKPSHSHRQRLNLPPELKPFERQIRKELETDYNAPPEIPEGCNFVITTRHPAIAAEFNRRYLAAWNRDPLIRAYEKGMRDLKEQQQ